MDKAKIAFAVVVVTGFAVFAIFLVSNADTQNQSEWERWVYVFGAVEAIAFAAVGWVFGREVNRQRAENAEDAAEQAAESAAQSREKGAKLAGMVIAGSGGGGRQRLEQMGAGGISEAVEFARRNFPDTE